LTTIRGKNLRKLRQLIFIIVVLILMVSGCSDQGDDTEAVVSPEQSASGGVLEPAENINLKSIDISLSGNVSVVILSMLSGSRIAGYPESKLTQLPEYEVKSLPQPQRIMITLRGMSFWDYEQAEDIATTDLVTGVFQEVPSDDESLIIYLQLSQDADITIEESEGDLILNLTPTDETADAQYYCVSDSFTAHQNGTWPDSIDMSPVLCSDGESRLLISAPFDTQDEAAAFMDEANIVLEEELPGNAAYVVKLSSGALPDFSPDSDFATPEENDIVIEDGILADTPLLLQNGRYLASASDGRIAFSRSYKPEEPALEQDAYLLSEKLWIQNTNGRIYSLDVSDFYMIDEAAFSGDNRYIAILDVSIDNRVLYVYDFEADDLINLGEEGFGSQTAAFAWSDSSNTLYAMTGNDAMQMRACVFAPDGTHEIRTVEEQAGAEGHIAVSQGRIFFADNYAGKGGIIYEIYESGEERRELTNGIDFSVSPDGSMLLAREIQPSVSPEEEQVLTALKLYDLETGEVTRIVEQAIIESFCFSQNGGKVYYNNAIVDEQNMITGYDFAIYAYDIVKGESEMVALCRTGVFAPSGTAGQIYLIDSIDESGNLFATYVYDIN